MASRHRPFLALHGCLGASKRPAFTDINLLLPHFLNHIASHTLRPFALSAFCAGLVCATFGAAALTATVAQGKSWAELARLSGSPAACRGWQPQAGGAASEGLLQAGDGTRHPAGCVNACLPARPPSICLPGRLPPALLTAELAARTLPCAFMKLKAAVWAASLLQAGGRAGSVGMSSMTLLCEKWRPRCAARRSAQCRIWCSS